MNEVKELLGLNGKNIRVIEIDEEKRKDKIIKVVTVIGTTKKVKCPICEKYTSSIHDTLKPFNLKYVKVAEYECYLKIIKKKVYMS